MVVLQITGTSEGFFVRLCLKFEIRWIGHESRMETKLYVAYKDRQGE